MIIDKKILDDLSAKAKESPRLRCNLDMRNSAEDQSQRMLNALEPGTVVPIHRHEDTSETNICLKGNLDVVFLKEVDGKLEEEKRITLCPTEGKYGVQIPKGVWHTVEVSEESVIVEMKNGKYFPQK